MILNGMQWLCENRDYGMYVELLACFKHEGGRTVAKPVEFELEEVPRHAAIERGTISLDQAGAASLMTALWNAGIRPHGLKATDAEVKRLEDHLTDMRKLVFDAKS